MFRKTGRKFLGPVLFSPGAKRRLAAMSILSTLFPLALSVSAQALAAQAPVTVEPLPAPDLAPLVAQPVSPAPASVIPVVVDTPTPVITPVAPKPAPVV